MEAPKQTLLTVDNVESAEPPRRLHGSLRVGSEAVYPEPSKTFNLRPSLEDLAEEQSLTIEINGWPAATLVCSPSALTELALGWSFARGYFDSPDDICSAVKLGDRVSIMLDHPGPRGNVWAADDSAGFDATLLQSIEHEVVAPIEELSEADELPVVRFDRVQFISIVERIFTRIKSTSTLDGIHYAAISDGDQLSAIARDVCRQNAVDKIIGWTINQRQPRTSLMLCVSGRVTADIAVKATRAGFPILVSRSVPTNEAVEIAHARGLTLVGRILDPQRAIYAHPWRLTHQDPE